MKVFTNLILIVCLATTGCATVFNGTDANVHITSQDPNAEIFVDGRFVGKGQATAIVNKKGSHFITAKKKGCSDGSTPIRKTFDPVSLLGVLIDFGLISIIFVDGLATGAINDISPKQYSVTPRCG